MKDKVKEKKVKKYIIDGRVMHFNFTKFKSAFSKTTQLAGLNIGTSEQILADALNVGVETVRGWRKMKNSPKDIETVARIAEYFGIDIVDFFVDVKDINKGENTMNTWINWSVFL